MKQLKKKDTHTKSKEHLYVICQQTFHFLSPKNTWVKRSNHTFQPAFHVFLFSYDQTEVMHFSPAYPRSDSKSFIASFWMAHIRKCLISGASHNDTFEIFQSKWTFLSHLKSMHLLWEYGLRPCKILFLFHIHQLVLASNRLYCYYDDY